MSRRTESNSLPLPRRSFLLRVEELEPRDVPASIDPAQIRAAYGFDRIITDGSLPGTGQTIAIVAAYDHPTIAADLATFSARYGLPGPASFTKVSQTGDARDLPRVDAGWASEIALDVQWAHAIAPGADILLVEADSNSLVDMLAAVDYARSQPGVSVVSMSWGGPEFAYQENLDTYFTTPAGHTGVTFVAASGDSGAGASWPAVSPNVLAVGGTTLTVTSDGAIATETAWAGSGGGASAFTPRPEYQDAVTGSPTRVTPDVAYNADPRTGFEVYDSLNGGWYTVGGTSAGAPQWAALVAIANQARELAGKAPLDGPSQTLYALYEAAQQSQSLFFNDVTGGSNGHAAGAGHDRVTGLGSPVADQVVAALVAWNGTGSGGGFGPAAPQPATTRTAGTRPTRPVPVSTAPPVLVAFAAPAPFAAFAPGSAASAPVVVPVVPAAQLVAVQPVAVGPSASQTAAYTPSLPLNASASGPGDRDEAGEASGFWEWLFGPAVDGGDEAAGGEAEAEADGADGGDGAEGADGGSAVAAAAAGE